MKFSEWMIIREQAPIAPVSPQGTQQGTKLPQPGEKARQNKTRSAIQRTRADTLGKPPKVQIAALQNTARRLATDPNADDDAMKDIDNEVKSIQAQSGIKA